MPTYVKKYSQTKKIVYLFFLICTYVIPARATHLNGGWIEAKRLSASSKSFEIKIFLLHNGSSTVAVGSGEVDFGDGTTLSLGESGSDLFHLESEGDLYQLYSLTLEHTYPASGIYMLTFFERNRSITINAPNSVDEIFWIDYRLVIDPLFGPNSSPEITYKDFFASSGIPFSYALSAFDPDGDSLSFHLAVPRLSKNRALDNYLYPDDQFFYSDSDVDRSDLILVPYSGELQWDSPGMLGEYAIAIRIKEWRKLDGQVYKVGEMVYDVIFSVGEPKDQIVTWDLPEASCISEKELWSEMLFVSSDILEGQMIISSDLPGLKVNGKLMGFQGNIYQTALDFAGDIELGLEVNYSDELLGNYRVVFDLNTSEGEFIASKALNLGFGCSEIGYIPVLGIEADVESMDVLIRQVENVLILSKAEGLEDHKVGVLLYDIKGNKVLSGELKVGVSEIKLDTDLVTNQIYILRSQKEGRVQSRKLLLLN